MHPPGTPNGTKPPRKDPNGKPKNRPGASQPHGGNKNPKKKGNIFDITPLNPPFDPRMRRIGSPLNQTAKIKRGWIQSDDGSMRVNFLYNPSELDLSHSVDGTVPTSTQLGESPPQPPGTNPVFAATNSSLSVQLLYDRTYELFSKARGQSNQDALGFANNYGVWADVAAWYTYLGMLPAYPTSWDDSILTSPARYIPSWLFIGSKMVFYGWPQGLSVVYSHWNQQMVPSRCAVSFDFTILPYTGTAPLQGQKDIPIGPGGWLGDWGSLDPSSSSSAAGGATIPSDVNPFF